MKKTIAILLVLVMVMGMTACDTINAGATYVETVPATTEPVVEQEETKPIDKTVPATTPVVEQETTPAEETTPATTTPVVEQEKSKPATTAPVVKQETTPVEETKPATTEPVVEQEKSEEESKPTEPPKAEALVHNHNYTVMVTAATCTEDGYTTYTCACGDSYHEGLKAYGHEYETRNGAITSATCTEDGCVFYQCEHCGDTYTEVLKAHGHEYVTEVVAPTEQDRGYTIHTCVHCGESYVDNYTAPVVPEPEPDDWVDFYDPDVVAINGEHPVDMLRSGIYTVTFADGSSATLIVFDGTWWYE